MKILTIFLVNVKKNLGSLLPYMRADNMKISFAAYFLFFFYVFIVFFVAGFRASVVSGGRHCDCGFAARRRGKAGAGEAHSGQPGAGQVVACALHGSRQNC